MPKIKPEHYVTIDLDIPRWIGYTWGDVEDLSGTLKMDLLGEGGMLWHATQQNPRVFNLILQTGLKHWSPQLQYEAVRDLVQDRLNKGGKFPDLVKAVFEAFRVAGLLGEEAGALPTETGPVGPGQQTPVGGSGAVGPGASRPLAAVPTPRSETDDEQHPQ